MSQKVFLFCAGVVRMSIVCSTLLQSFCNKCVRSLVISGIIASVWVIAGCTTTDSIQSDAANEAVDLAWPLPPEQPRIKFIRAFFSEDQIVTKEEVSTISM